jgi:hypothetical protein
MQVKEIEGFLFSPYRTMVVSRRKCDFARMLENDKGKSKFSTDGVSVRR